MASDGDGITAGKLTTITNQGSLWAGVSTDGGKTIKWGNAIDTLNAPNPVVIKLEDPVVVVHVASGPDDLAIFPRTVIRCGASSREGWASSCIP